jgi:hypothetical protein
MTLRLILTARMHWNSGAPANSALRSSLRIRQIPLVGRASGPPEMIPVLYEEADIIDESLSWQTVVTAGVLHRPTSDDTTTKSVGAGEGVRCW